ncbi:winged helix DNA-binding protein [Sphingomonas jatrophae]|uniref:Winged helix DNA-binding domain-containing protein n=1 Tax=Sphingomonas jatrophae TaxID=1166337 RepID=A0A1I6LLZ3_9SPHN|nr:winged helix DNA-binding protein [Sphingomonas jatrophae]SFS04433.1 Winged helix DNA-binding domain-containing protein [Sphingomonas jatrophae]
MQGVTVQPTVLTIGGAALCTLVEAVEARTEGPVAPEAAADALLLRRPDAVLADLRGVSPSEALIDALAEVGGVVIVSRADLDEAGALAFPGGPRLLCDPEPTEIAGELALSLAALRGGVREEEDQAHAARLRRLSEEMARLARAISDISEEAPSRAPYVAAPAPPFRGSAPATPVQPAAIRAMIRARRQRDQVFGEGLFADPAWDMLLDLTAARMEGVRVSVSSLCIAAAVPSTTALRWIKLLADAELIVRDADPNDRRRVFVVLSPKGQEGMTACLAAAAKGGCLPM